MFLCVSRDACELSQYDCGAAENSRVQVRMPFILEEEWGGRHRGGAGGAGTWGRWLHLGWTLSPPTIKYFLPDHCSTCSINKQIFIIAGQVSGLGTIDVKDTGPCPWGPPPQSIRLCHPSRAGFWFPTEHSASFAWWPLVPGVWGVEYVFLKGKDCVWLLARPLESGQGLAQRGRFSEYRSAWINQEAKELAGKQMKVQWKNKWM